MKRSGLNPTSSRWWLTSDTLRVMERVGRAVEFPVRLRLLAALVADERNVTTLTRLTGYSQPQVSKHLAVLRQLGIVQRRAQRTQRFYQLAAGDPAAQAIRALLVALSHPGHGPGQP